MINKRLAKKAEKSAAAARDKMGDAKLEAKHKKNVDKLNADFEKKRKRS